MNNEFLVQNSAPAPENIMAAAPDLRLENTPDAPAILLTETLLEDMDFSTFTYCVLSRAGIRTRGEIEKMTKTELSQLDHMRSKGIEEIAKKCNLRRESTSR